MGCNVWDNISQKQKLKAALEQFRSDTPYLTVLRNVGEHFDDYLTQKGRLKSVNSRGIRVYSDWTGGPPIGRVPV